MKKLVIFIISLLLFISPVFAQELGSNSNGYERNETNNYGVNKKFNINESNMSNVLSTPYVDSNKKIYDFVNIISEEDEKEINELIDGFISTTKLDFVFVSINMPYSNDNENDSYAHDFYDYNDFGINNERYGGIIIVRNTYESDPYYLVLLKGEAQLYCSSSELDNLTDNLYDYFHSGNYKDGLISFLHSFNNLYSKGYDEEKYYIDENGVLIENKSLNYLPSIISGFLVSLFTMLGMVKKNKMVRKAINANDYLIKNSVEYINKSDNLISTITTHHTISSDPPSSGSSHSSFGSSGFGGMSSGRHG